MSLRTSRQGWCGNPFFPCFREKTRGGGQRSGRPTVFVKQPNITFYKKVCLSEGPPVLRDTSCRALSDKAKHGDVLSPGQRHPFIGAGCVPFQREHQTVRGVHLLHSAVNSPQGAPVFVHVLYGTDVFLRGGIAGHITFLNAQGCRFLQQMLQKGLFGSGQFCLAFAHAGVFSPGQQQKGISFAVRHP